MSSQCWGLEVGGEGVAVLRAPMAVFFRVHVAFPPEGLHPTPLLYKDTNHSGLGTTLMTSLELCHLSGCSPNTVTSETLGTRTSTHEFGEGEGTFHPIASCHISDPKPPPP